MDGGVVTLSFFYAVLAGVGLITYLIGVISGLVIDLKVRKRNRRAFDAGGRERGSMLDRPEKTMTKCGQVYCRDDRSFLNEQDLIKNK
jgi:hypothetical protein